MDGKPGDVFVNVFSLLRGLNKTQLLSTEAPGGPDLCNIGDACRARTAVRLGKQWEWSLMKSTLDPPSPNGKSWNIPELFKNIQYKPHDDMMTYEHVMYDLP